MSVCPPIRQRVSSTVRAPVAISPQTVRKTSFPLPRPTEREAGRLINLAAGRSYRTQLAFTLHADKASVREAAQRIEKIRGDRRTTLVPEPSAV